jgi:hypothetical protein
VEASSSRAGYFVRAFLQGRTKCDFTECADPIKTIFTTNPQVLHDELKSIYDEGNEDTCGCTDERTAQ